jgi:hypothetical protein
MIDETQIAAINVAEKLAKALASSCPEIADEYRSGRTLSDIAATQFPSPRSDSVARSAVYYALKLLLSKEEMEKLGNGHRDNSRRKVLDEGRGLATLTSDQRRKIGRRVLEEGLGAHSLTPNQRSFFGRQGGIKRAEFFDTKFQSQAGRASALARGYVPFMDKSLETEFGQLTEEAYLVQLRNSPEYQGWGAWKRITEKVNSVFENGRSVDSVKNRYYSFVEKD